MDSTPDGRIVAVVAGVRLECWSPPFDEPLWRLPIDDGGYQVTVLPDGATALVLTRGSASGRGSVVAEVDLGDGSIRAVHEPGYPAVMVSRADGAWALRDTRHARTTPGQVTIQPPSGRTVTLGRYDLFNHFFDIRRAPDLLFLQGRADEPWRDKWVVRVGVDGDVRRLFPLEWDQSRDGHLYGGSGAYLDDRSGPSLVHSGVVHNGAGLLPGNAFVVRRAYPSGEPQWVFTADHQVTALDADGEFVHVAFNSGELVVLRVGDGAVHARHALCIDGHRVVPLSLVRTGSAQLAIGTRDGRVLVCSLDAGPAGAVRCRA
jgi:hypothetical protein